MRLSKENHAITSIDMHAVSKVNLLRNISRTQEDSRCSQKDYINGKVKSRNQMVIFHENAFIYLSLL